MFSVEPDIRVASTLDKRFYLDEAVWAQARERVFARSWQWIGELADVAEPGSLAPRELLPGLLDEPLLLARDGAGELRCLSNVCTHRGNVLVHAPCRAEQIRCGYHSRRFDLAGKLCFMPEFEQAQNFPAASDHLPHVPFGSLGPQGFASLTPAAPLADFTGDLQARLAWLPLHEFRADATRNRDYEFDAHWALYVENYLEGLHIPFVHPGLMQSLDMGGYEDELYRYSTLQLATARPGEPAFDLPESSPDHGRRIAAYYWWIFPNLMLNFYPWGLSLNLVMPLGPSRTRVAFRAFVWRPERLDSGAGGGLDQVEMEDEAVVLGVQRGLRSRLYSRGRYAPTRERGVHHFHRLLGEFMAAPA
ncbi:aromatic ring-hydroxylating oxygenase subunit alpha [Rivibacter subsaxonicus]|uniref:Choline monooxygenase n=1 Tax=Rivibacter subsaxonicus TaxID=457575 RepID=A0A4Q7VZA9_9BURK|nr:aromatic ring-hydroxylating dioxygenase subunit alpha [Rivibacter subsaxonicus]RZU02194.1 choline monooxygenase [Rivibacter subsaxonicus]